MDTPNLGYGLERWATESGDTSIWSAGTEGCGLVVDGVFLDPTGREQRPPAKCLDLVDDFERHIESFEPDVVAVLVQGPDYVSRRLDGWAGFLSPGDQTFDDWLVDEYVALYDTFTARGAQVVWFDPPCATDPLGLLGDDNPMSLDRIGVINDSILPRLADARPELVRYDLFSLLCPGGDFSDTIGGVADARPYGVHLSADAATWVGGIVGADLRTMVEAAD